MKASVIIPVWNGREYLPSCLDALLVQGHSDLEVVVVDNASADGSADLVAEQYPHIRLIRNPVNLGFAGGGNIGLRAARGDVLVLLNQDTRVLPGWLRALIESLRRPEVGVVGCKILYPDGKTIQHAGGWIEWPLGLAHHYGKGEQDDGQWDEAREVEYVTGAAMAFRRGILQHVGMLDKWFWPGYFEDADFCFRVREAGYEIWYEPKAVLIHHETTSLKHPDAVSRVYQRGRLRFLLKHLPPERLLTEFLPAEITYQPAAIRGQESLALPLAYLEAIPMAVRLLRQRWHADDEQIRAVLVALQTLYRRAWMERWYGVFELDPSLLTVGALSFSVPPLREFEFRSAAPVIGPIITRFRSWWYNIAARWAVRHLMEQQNTVNQEMVSILTKLAEEILTLGYQIAEQATYLYPPGDEDESIQRPD